MLPVFLLGSLLLSSGESGEEAGTSPASGAAHEHAHHAAADGSHEGHHGATHRGQLGAWPMNREVSGTAWQPDSSPMPGIHFGSGAWTFMAHGFVDAVYSDESGPRGDSGGFGTGMAMIMGRRSLGGGAIGFRVMATAEPAMGAEGYPLLLQTGETADGINPLVDRQHPHDMLMELAGTWSYTFANGNSVFTYLALAGEPPIGPPAFMHRPSGDDNPLAPISHHFLDSTHVTHGVATFGFATDEGLKLEVGAFNGHEPDQDRWGIETPSFNSIAARIGVNPHEDWSLQVSFAQLDSPEQLHQGLDVQRLTASVTYNRPLSRGNWQSLLAWGRNKRETPPTVPGSVPVVDAGTGTHVHYSLGGAPGVLPSRLSVQNALLVESSLNLARWHTLYGRFENAQKDELFPPSDARHSTVFAVIRATVGYVFDVPVDAPFRMGVGVSGSFTWLPPELHDTYGSSPGAVTAFLRMKLGR